MDDALEVGPCGRTGNGPATVVGGVGRARDQGQL